MFFRQKKMKIHLSASDMRKLQLLLREGRHSVWVIKRAQILQALHKGHGVAEIASILRVSLKTPYNTVQAYQKGGLEYAIYDRSRPGRAAALNEKQDSHIVALACSHPPAGSSRWTVQLLVEAAKKTKVVMTVGRETVRKLLKNHSLKPWREKMWCVAVIDQEYIRKMEDVLAVYEKPYDPKHPVICVDEKPVQLLSELHATLPAQEHQIKRRDYEYKREGVANVFCAIEPKTGQSILAPTPNRKAEAFAKFFRSVVDRYPNAEKIHLVCDNLNTHCEKSLIKKYGE